MFLGAFGIECFGFVGVWGLWIGTCFSALAPWRADTQEFLVLVATPSPVIPKLETLNPKP